MSIIEGSSFRISATVMKDDVVADLTDSTPVIAIRKPNGVDSYLATTVDVVASGIIHADVTASGNSMFGTWLTWAEVTYSGGLFMKTMAKSIVVSELGTVG